MDRAPGAGGGEAIAARRSALGRPLGLAVLLAGAVLHARAGYFQDDLSGHARGSDDAYISYRYARNLARGEGLVFNPGERVEGYSNLLYVMLLAPVAGVAGDDAVYPVSVALNLLFAAGAWAVFMRLAERRLGGRRAALASLLFGLGPALWLWTASGMETPLVLLLQIALWAFVDDAAHGAAARPGRLALLVLLSVLSRADGFMLPVLALAYLFAIGRRREAAAGGGVLAVALAALVGWRLSYYGHPLPNTYYVKVSGPLGERLLQGVLQLLSIVLNGGLLPHVAALLLAAVVAVRPGGGGKRAGLRFEVAFGLSLLVFWIYLGGDVFAERMLLVLYPIGISLLLDPALLCAPERTISALAAVTAAFQLLPLAIDTRFGYRFDRYDRWVLVGQRLAQPRYAGQLLAVDAAGKIPFYSGLRTVDMLGLNDEHIAHLDAHYFEAGHNKHDADYVLARQPDVVADWIDPRLDLRFGLTHEKYERAGYRLEALVFTRKDPAGAPPLVDVGPETSPADLDVLIRRGYRYALLVREDVEPPHPALSPDGGEGLPRNP